MGKELNTNFLSLLRNEKFIRLVRQSDNPSELLERLQARYPDGADSIRDAFQFIRANLMEKRKLDSNDFNRILNDIQHYSKNKKRAGRRRIVFHYSWRAAVILFILAIGTLVVVKEVNDPMRKFAQNTTEMSEQSMLVLSDGTKRLLQHDDSFIEYDSRQAEVVVRKDEKEEERIENKGEPDKQILNQIIVPFGQKQTVALHDGTVVQLNAGSSLTFPAKFSGKTREVYLKGEGYFEVQKNEHAPFIVRTEQMDVKVLGTSFNIAAYTDEKIVSTILVEGSVQVKRKGRLLFNEEYRMKPGEGFFYTVGSGEPVVQPVNVNDYTSWKEGVFIFREKPLLEIVKRVKKYYDKPIQIEGEVLAKTLVTGKLDISGDFDLAMRYLAKTIEGQYEKTPDGTYVLKTFILH